MERPFPAKHAISLLVHEQLPVIVDQCRNLAFFAPQAVVMLHRSPSADFTHEALAAALAEAGLTRARVNPVSVKTQWGGIVEAHLANIAALADYCTADSSVSFHSSNDMLLVRLPEMGRPGLAWYGQREISPASRWSTGRKYCRTPGFAELLAALDCTRAVGSQIEGSTFPYAVVAELAARMRAAPELARLLPPIAEEMLFATYAANHGVPSTGHPYVLMRAHIMGSSAVGLLPGPLRNTAPAWLLHKAMARLEGRLKGTSAALRDVEAIIAGKPLTEPDWAHSAPPRGALTYHGIKRVERRIDDPLRIRIRQHLDACQEAEARR
ncbi:MAG: hypothetical protein JSS36_02155 [Proteobacteria bacterium]|nr:hypothetical protein [Pseudomonadota bacterium]